MSKDEITQLIRVADVVIVMPIMLMASANKNLNPSLRIALGVTGVATGIYNGVNFVNNLK